MAFNFKRKRTMAPRSAGFKKRKTVNKRRQNRRGGRKIADFTSLNQRGTTVGFRAKKTSRKVYKRWLWNSTLFKTHFRSLFAVNTAIITPANNTEMTIGALNLYRNGLGSKFWTAAGGLVAVDVGVTPPLFTSDIILRGGVWQLTFHNPAATDVMITVWEAFTVPDPLFSLLPTTAVKGWEPSVSGDFTTLIGRPMNNRTVLLEGGNAYTISGRFRTQKLDQAVYELDGRAPFVFFAACNVGTIVPVTINLVRTMNVSFSADAVGTT